MVGTIVTNTMMYLTDISPIAEILENETANIRMLINMKRTEKFNKSIW